MSSISLHRAKRIINQVFEYGKQQQLRPLAVAVVDQGGHVIAFERQDGAPPGRFNLSYGKARAAILMGLGGTSLQNLSEQRSDFALAANGAYNGDFVPIMGAVLVQDKHGKTIGAIGVSGATSEEDKEAGCHAIAAVNLVAIG